MKYYEDIYRLAYIKRYSNIPTIHEESVAEHGFFVAAIVIKLHDTYDFDIGFALLMAVAHDMPEMELNDCPHIIKERYPQIKEAYDVCEKEVVKQFPPSIRQAVHEYDKQRHIEAKIVHLADAMQCAQFSKSELKLGNTGYMTIVYDTSINRVKKLKGDLHGHRRNTEK